LKLYAETSAVLAWLFGESVGHGVHRHLAKAELIISSDLTLVECERVLIRAQKVAGVTETQAADRRAVLNRAANHWYVLHLHKEVIERACRPFPNEPIRTLDMLHLSCALLGRSIVPGLFLLSLDERIRTNAEGLGFDLLPERSESR
jgi:predicted nucleic acid-binding protein